MSKFKRGDIVRCIQNGLHTKIRVGDICAVEVDRGNGLIRVKEFPAVNFNESRFVHVDALVAAVMEARK